MEDEKQYKHHKRETAHGVIDCQNTIPDEERERAGVHPDLEDLPKAESPMEKTEKNKDDDRRKYEINRIHKGEKKRRHDDKKRIEERETLLEIVAESFLEPQHRCLVNLECCVKRIGISLNR